MHLQYLKRFFNELSKKKILDVGCGRGDFLLECHKEGLDITGIDIDSEYIKISEEKIKKSGFESHIVLAKGEELPFKDNYFDFINCVEVLEHTQDPEKVLTECYRVLKNNGQVFATIHNKFGIKDAHYKLLFLNWLPRFLKNKYIKFMGRNKEKHGPSGSQGINEMHYFTYAEFQKMVQKIGFKIKDVRSIQLNNPEIIINRRIKKILTMLKKTKIINSIKIIYFPLRFLYSNTFHIILTK